MLTGIEARLVLEGPPKVQANVLPIDAMSFTEDLSTATATGRGSYGRRTSFR
jgi:hypothetical protein